MTRLKQLALLGGAMLWSFASLCFSYAVVSAALNAPLPLLSGWTYRGRINDQDSRAVLDAIDKAARDAMIATREHIRFNDPEHFDVEVLVHER